MSESSENLSRAKIIAKVIAKEDARTKGGKVSDHYCSILLSELDTKDAKIKKLTEALATVNQCSTLDSKWNPFFGKFRALLAEIKG